MTLNNNTIKLEFAERMRVFQSKDFQMNKTKMEKIHYKKQLDEEIRLMRDPLVQIQKLNLEDFSASMQLAAIPKKVVGVKSSKLKFDRKAFLAKIKTQVLQALRKDPTLDVGKYAKDLQNVAQ
jgi:hypothetical protein